MPGVPENSVKPPLGCTPTGPLRSCAGGKNLNDNFRSSKLLSVPPEQLRASGNVSLHQGVPRATDGLLQFPSSREQDIDVPSFNLLDCPQMKIREVGKLLLCHADGRSLASNGGTEFLDCPLRFGMPCHPAIRSNIFEMRNAPMGRKMN